MDAHDALGEQVGGGGSEEARALSVSPLRQAGDCTLFIPRSMREASSRTDIVERGIEEDARRLAMGVAHDLTAVDVVRKIAQPVKQCARDPGWWSLQRVE
jgi:hypothetical protein